MPWNTLVHPNKDSSGSSVLRLVATTCLLAMAVLLGMVGDGRAVAKTSTAEYGLIPLFFIPNHGQVDSQVRFMTKTPALSAYFTPKMAVLTLQGTTVRLVLAGANPSPRLEGLHQLPGKVNFLMGNRPDQWRTGIPAFAGLVYREAYQGIDLFYAGSDRRLKSEFVVQPGADPSAIRWQYEGIKNVRLDTDGALVLTSEVGELREERPEIYQEIEGHRVGVEGGYRLSDDGSVSFRIGEYDPAQPLVIDPVFSYSTYLGGSGLDVANAIAVDAGGNTYVTGHTDSLDFPTHGSLQETTAGGVDVFVAKVNDSGTALVYCTYLGGSWDDRGQGIAVGSNGNAYVTGYTSSPDFPTSSGARQRLIGGGRDAFAVGLSADGNSLVFSTYIGGVSHDGANGIALDSSGNVYLVGDTYSSDFPTLSAFQSSLGGLQDAFVAKLKADGSTLLWSTFLGGGGDENGSAVGVDEFGNAYVTGGTDSVNFPILTALQGSSGGAQDAFVAKLSGSDGTLTYSTYLGGSGGTLGANEAGTGIAVDSSGNAYVTGSTSSLDFPVLSALQTMHGGGITDAFVAKVNATGSSLLYSTYLGGIGLDQSNDIAADASGAVWLTGYTSSSNFPTANALQSASGGGYDGFVVKLNPSGTGLEASTYLGGSNSDAGNAVAVDTAGNAYVVGQTVSSDFPLRKAILPTNGGGLSAFVSKISHVVPTAVYRSTSGATMLSAYGSTGLSWGSGMIDSEPGASQNTAGETFVVGRNSINDVWLNCHRNTTQSWTGWVLAGGPFAGDPVVAATLGGDAYVVARDAGLAYWLNHYVPGSGFDGWIGLGGTFSSDPSLAAAPDGSVYIVGRIASGEVLGGRYASGSGFQGWVSGGGAGAPVAAGKPVVAMGSDGAAYVSIKGANKAIWMARLQDNTWGPWTSGGGVLGSDPDLAAAAGLIHAVVTGPTGRVYVQSFQEGIGGGWRGWVSTSGTLSRASIAALGTRYFVVGRNSLNHLWWYESGGVGWTFSGYLGTSVSDVNASP